MRYLISYLISSNEIFHIPFLILSLINLVCMLYLQHISTWTRSLQGLKSHRRLTATVSGSTGLDVYASVSFPQSISLVLEPR